MGERERSGEEEKRSLIKGVGLVDEVKLYRGSKIISTAQKLSLGQVPEIISPEMAVDVFYSFFYPVPRMDDEALQDLDPTDEAAVFRAKVLEKLLMSPNLWRAKPYTTADSLTSVVAAASFVERLARMLSRMQRSNSGRSGEEGDRREGRGESGESGESQSGMDEEKLGEAVEKALETAEKDASAAKNLKQLLSMMGAGDTSVLAFDENFDLILRIARETDVSRILENVQGIKEIIRKRSRRESRSPKGWMEGLEYGSDLERLHYSQLVLPDEYFWASYSSSKLLLYRKVLDSAMGPIYVLLDKSGSMVGAKIDWARAVAVALFKRSLSENRRFSARFFDSITYPAIHLRPSSKPKEFLELVKYLAAVKAGGGTDITAAIRTAAEDIVKSPRGEEKVSDIVLITDGEDRLNSDVVEQSLKRAGARLHTVVVQGHNPYLKRVSYRYMSVRKLENKEAVRVIDFD
ncbi:MAG: VWA domain-containing protein [Aeropyrum sp.]|nr:VWA domain-containing protein [Aeropyrum sp.]